MVRNIDHASRKKSVLGATINRYIKNPLPVASEDVSDLFSLSSSTIRNIFAELEDEGLLTHPHTSAGRVPTNKGYRYYVDVLLSQAELLDDEKQRIIKELCEYLALSFGKVGLCVIYKPGNGAVFVAINKRSGGCN